MHIIAHHTGEDLPRRAGYEQRPGASAIEASKTSRRLFAATLPDLLKLVQLRLWVGIPDFPEALDKGLPLVIPLEIRKGLELVIGGQDIDLLEPGAMVLGESALL